MTGVSTRVIEVIGAPFDNEAAASEMHQHSGDNTGWAGDAFLDYIISLGDEVIAGYFNELFDEVKPLIGTANGSHAAGIAAVVTADYLLSRLFFAERDSEARAHALQMAQAVLGEMQAARCQRERRQLYPRLGDFGQHAQLRQGLHRHLLRLSGGRGGVYHPDLVA